MNIEVNFGISKFSSWHCSEGLKGWLCYVCDVAIYALVYNFFTSLSLYFIYYRKHYVYVCYDNFGHLVYILQVQICIHTSHTLIFTGFLKGKCVRALPVYSRVVGGHPAGELVVPDL